MRSRPICTCLLMTSFFAWLAGPQARARPLTLDEAIALALRHSPEIRARRLQREKARFQKWSALGQMGPRLGLNGKLMRWDKPTDVDMGFDVPPELLKQLGLEIPSSLRVMDQTTAELSLVVAQPLTPLYSLVSLYKLQGHNELAAQAEARAKAQELAYKVAQAYFGILRLKRARQTVLKAIEQVKAHLKTAKAFYEQGYVQKDDVLRAEVALSKAQDRLRQVETSLEVAKAGLNVLLGRPMNSEVELSDDYPDPPPALEFTLDEAVKRALRNRAELKQARERLKMAEAAKQAAIGQMLPTISFVFNFSRQWGNEFQRKTYYFFGGMLEWNFFEWGSQYFQIKAAERDVRAAKEAIRGISDLVTLDVKKAYLNAQLAYGNIETARTAIRQAKESFRIVSKKYEQRLATSLEVMDAESALTQAKNSYYDALYSYYLALENLERAMGEKNRLQQVGR